MDPPEEDEALFHLTPEQETELHRRLDRIEEDRQAGRLVPAIYLDANGKECFAGIDD